MDNVCFYHLLINYYDTLHHTVNFLSRYSPFLNSCEEAYSAIKSVFRRNNAPVGTD
ncbi:hypothetical protein GVAV_003459 [Gurleya vavrai]